MGDAWQRSPLPATFPAGSGADVAFGYNPAGQLVSQTRDNDAYAWSQHWNQDLAYGTDGKNRIASITGLSAPTYDAQQNMTSDGAQSFGYDLLGRLTGYASGTGALAYDPGGRLYETDPPAAAATRFGYDGLQAATEVNGSGAVLRRYIPGPGLDQPVAWYEGSGTGTVGWYLADHQGSIVAVADSAGVAQVINAYDEYGAPNSGNAGGFGYTGQMWLPQAGVYHYRARAYQPVVGRFLQPDLVGYGAGMNLYAYVGNDPVSWVDPLGLAPCPSGTPSNTICLDDLVVTGFRRDECNDGSRVCISGREWSLQVGGHLTAVPGLGFGLEAGIGFSREGRGPLRAVGMKRTFAKC